MNGELFQYLNHPAWRVMLVGRSGNGKSTYWNRVILNAPHRRKFVFDHEGEFCQRNGFAPATSPTELDASLGTGWTVFDPSPMFAGRLAAAFAFFCDWVFEVSGYVPGTKLFACDEIQKFTQPDKDPVQFLKVIETGRRRAIDALFISQASNRIHNSIRNQVTEIVTFRQSDEQAVKFLRDQGFDEDAVRGLHKGDFILRNDHVEQTGNVFRFPVPGTRGSASLPGKFVTTKVLENGGHAGVVTSEVGRSKKSSAPSPVENEPENSTPATP